MIEDDFKNLLSKYSNWIKINDPKSKWTIEDFPYETGVDEKITYPHCWRCVTVNNCWFKNETNKKPQIMNYSFQFIANLFEKYGLNAILGLYHPNCHCSELPINIPTENEIQLIVPPGKIDWLFKDKMKWLISMGYTESDKDLILKNLYKSCKQAYCQGKYKLKTHTKYGFMITLNIDFIGGNNKIHKLNSSFMIFPNGKLKNNTLIGGDQ